MKHKFKSEMDSDLRQIESLIKLLKDKQRAVKIEVPASTESEIYWIEKNKHVIQMLKKERKLLKKKLNWRL